MPSVHFLTLGCAANEADTLTMQRALGGHLHVTDDPAQAEVVVVNSCALTEADQSASIEAILSMAALRDKGPLSKLVVAGCLAPMHGAELTSALPEIDLLLGPDDAPSIAQRLGLVPGIEAVAPNPSPRGHPSGTPSWTLALRHGCSSPCTFCVVPALRGPARSRPVTAVRREVQAGIAQGATEFVLVAHDVATYGMDLSGPEAGSDLIGLMDALEAVAAEAPRPIWFKLRHAHPRALTDAVVARLARGNAFAPSLDVPIEHAADGVLRAMGRQMDGAYVADRLSALRAAIPALWLRSTAMVGFPGESEADFLALLTLVERGLIDGLEVRRYVPMPNTQAQGLGQEVPPDVAQARAATLADAQADVWARRQVALVGQTLRVWVEGPCPQTPLLWQGRHLGQVPGAGGKTYITGGRAAPGDIVSIRVEDVHDSQDVAGPIVSSHLGAFG